jgi:hypothetical protein
VPVIVNTPSVKVAANSRRGSHGSKCWFMRNETSEARFYSRFLFMGKVVVSFPLDVAYAVRATRMGTRVYSQ